RHFPIPMFTEQPQHWARALWRAMVSTLLSAGLFNGIQKFQRLLDAIDIFLVPADTRALYYGVGLSGRGGNWVDLTVRRGSGVDRPDRNHHLAMVRVAGSNPVFRSILPGGRHCFDPYRELTVIRFATSHGVRQDSWSRAARQ